MSILAIADVCCGRSFSRPGIGTGVSLPMSSTCGGRPGEKMRSLTSSDRPSIVLRTSWKLSVGAACCTWGGMVT
jgi:hypothetical protein